MDTDARAPLDARPTKTPDDSAAIGTRTVMNGDINGADRLFGGRLMEWIDSIAGIAARRHCGGSVTTACVDSLVFKNPAYLNEIVVIDAYVTYVGKTSLEVRVDSYVEDVATGERKQINVAYLTEVCVGEDERPRRIPFGLKLDTDEQRNEWHMAQIRKMIRRERQEQGI